MKLSLLPLAIVLTAGCSRSVEHLTVYEDDPCWNTIILYPGGAAEYIECQTGDYALCGRHRIKTSEDGEETIEVDFNDEAHEYAIQLPDDPDWPNVTIHEDSTERRCQAR